MSTHPRIGVGNGAGFRPFLSWPWDARALLFYVSEAT
jgi:hypothetical protein